jgi:signal transduction histidine kinase
MKKRIILGLAIFTSIFVLGEIYLIITIEKVTSTLNNLIKLHQVEIIREQLLIDSKRVQSDLALQYTRFARTIDTVITNVVEMDKKATKCLDCHHTAPINKKIHDLNGQIYAYERALSRYLTIRANKTRLEEEENKAFEVGHKLIDMLNEMTSLTKARLEKRTQTTLAKISEMKTLIFTLIIIGPIFAIGLAVVFTRELTRPLSLLLQATRKLKNGDLTFRVQGLKDEFGEMATAFNEMATSLNQQLHQMQRAEQMNMVGVMAAGLVHEIKNPLAGIKGSIQVFLEGADITEEERLILSKVINEVQRVELLIKSLLNFAKPPRPQFLPVNMNDILEATLISSLPHFSLVSDSPKAIKIVKHFDPHLPVIMADPMEMQQVFLNLIINAVQAMPAGGMLTVRTFENISAKEIQIEVADTGKGINDEIREKIFQPFFTTKNKGTGLGLAISKQFVEMNGGRISVEQNPGGGTIFRIVFTRIAAEEAHPPDSLA